MEVRYFKESKLLLIKITEEIDDCNVKEMRRKLDYEIERFCPKRVVFDYDSVTFMDSSGIGLIIGRYKQVALLGGVTEITNLSQNVRKIFEMSGILRLIPEINFNEENLKQEFENQENVNLITKEEYI